MFHVLTSAFLRVPHSNLIVVCKEVVGEIQCNREWLLRVFVLIVVLGFQPQTHLLSRTSNDAAVLS